MDARQKLLEILDKPIFPHESVDPLEAVTDYLLDNDVVPVVRCKDCVNFFERNKFCVRAGTWNFHTVDPNDFCSCGERKKQ